MHSRITTGKVVCLQLFFWFLHDPPRVRSKTTLQAYPHRDNQPLSPGQMLRVWAPVFRCQATRPCEACIDRAAACRAPENTIDPSAGWGWGQHIGPFQITSVHPGHGVPYMGRAGPSLVRCRPISARRLSRLTTHGKRRQHVGQKSPRVRPRLVEHGQMSTQFGPHSARVRSSRRLGAPCRAPGPRRGPRRPPQRQRQHVIWAFARAALANCRAERAVLRAGTTGWSRRIGAR